MADLPRIEGEAREQPQDDAPKWGDPLDLLSQDRKDKLARCLWDWRPEMANQLPSRPGPFARDHPGPFSRETLTGLDVFWLAICSLAGPDGDVAEAEQELRADPTFSGHPFLPGLHLEYARLVGAYLENANLIRAHLERANLEAAHLQRSLLHDTTLEGASLHGANLEGAIGIEHLDGANLVGAHLEGSDLSMAHLKGADLAGAHLQHANLGGAYLVGARRLGEAHLAGAQLAEAHMEGADLSGRGSQHRAHLEGANLEGAHLEGANLIGAHLEGANLDRAHLERANLTQSHLEGARFCAAHLEGISLEAAHLEGRYLPSDELARLQAVIPDFPTTLLPADLRGAYLDTSTSLAGVILGDDNLGHISVADVRWGGANLAVVKWFRLPGRPPRRRLAWVALGDERIAQAAKDRKGKPKNAEVRLDEFEAAVRANRQLATTLRDQGLNDDADRFAYQAQVLQREVLWRQGRWGAVIGSWLLDRAAGYGYKPGRTLVAYLVTLVAFTIAYLLAAGGMLTFGLPPSQFHALTWYEALILSISSFHGRGFFQPVQNLGDPVAILAALEAVFGLFIEVSFIATFTQRYFGK